MKMKKCWCESVLLVSIPNFRVRFDCEIYFWQTRPIGPEPNCILKPQQAKKCRISQIIISIVYNSKFDWPNPVLLAPRGNDRKKCWCELAILIYTPNLLVQFCSTIQKQTADKGNLTTVHQCVLKQKSADLSDKSVI